MSSDGYFNEAKNSADETMDALGRWRYGAGGFFAVTFSQSTRPRDASAGRADAQGIVSSGSCCGWWWRSTVRPGADGIHSYILSARVAVSGRTAWREYYAWRRWRGAVSSPRWDLRRVATSWNSGFRVIVAMGCIVLFGTLLFQLWIWW
jgi:hypothetical protein